MLHAGLYSKHLRIRFLGSHLSLFHYIGLPVGRSIATEGARGLIVESTNAVRLLYYSIAR